MVVDGVATKQDIAILKQDTALEITQLRQEVALVRSDMGKEFAEVRTEFANVRLEIHKESVKNLKIMGGMFVASTTLTIGVLGLLLK